MADVNNFGKFFDENPQYNKSLHYYSGTQAAKIFTDDAQNARKKLKPNSISNFNEEARIHDDHKVIDKLDPKKIYEGDQLHAVKVFGSRSPLTPVSRTELAQSVHRLLPDDPKLSQLVDKPQNKISAALKATKNPLVKVLGQSVKIKLHRAKPFYNQQNYHRLSQYLNYHYAKSINRVLHNWNQSTNLVGIRADYKPLKGDRQLANQAMKYSIMPTTEWNNKRKMTQSNVHDISHKLNQASHHWGKSDIQREEERRTHMKRSPYMPNVSTLDSSKVEHYANQQLHQLNGDIAKSRQKIQIDVDKNIFDNDRAKRAFNQRFTQAMQPINHQRGSWLKIKDMAMQHEARYLPIRAPEQTIKDGSYATKFQDISADQAKSDIKQLRKQMHRPEIWDNHQIQHYIDTHPEKNYQYADKNGQLHSYTKNGAAHFINTDYGSLDENFYDGLRGTASSVKSGGFFKAMRKTIVPQQPYTEAQRKALNKKVLKQSAKEDRAVRRVNIDKWQINNPNYTIENKMRNKNLTTRRAINAHDLADEKQFSKVIQDRQQNPADFLRNHHNLGTRLYLTVDNKGQVRDKNYQQSLTSGPYTRDNLQSKVDQNIDSLNQLVNGGSDMRVDEDRSHDPHYTVGVKEKNLTQKQRQAIDHQDYKDLQGYNRQLDSGVEGAYYLDQHPNLKTRLQVSTNHGRVTNREGTKHITNQVLQSAVNETLQNMSSNHQKKHVIKVSPAQNARIAKISRSMEQWNNDVDAVNKGRNKKAAQLHKKANQMPKRHNNRNRNRQRHQDNGPEMD